MILYLSEHQNIFLIKIGQQTQSRSQKPGALNAQGIRRRACKQNQAILLQAQEPDKMTAQKKGSVTKAVVYLRPALSHISAHTHTSL